jgi:hypothetical protein
VLRQVVEDRWQSVEPRVDRGAEAAPETQAQLLIELGRANAPGA